VRPPAESAMTSSVPAGRRAVRCLTHDRNASGRSSLQRAIEQLSQGIIDKPPKVPRERPARHRSGVGSGPGRIKTAARLTSTSATVTSSSGHGRLLVAGPQCGQHRRRLFRRVPHSRQVTTSPPAQ
jgi:hypothetical protein